MAVLRFADGPAAGQQDKVDWPEYWHWKDGVRYRVISIRADRAAAEDDPNPTLHTYALAEEDDGPAKT